MKTQSKLRKLESICAAGGIALCYLFGSQKDLGLSILRGGETKPGDPESDLDFAVLFREPPRNPLDAYARLSIELGSLVAPLKADLLFLHEVDHLIQLEAIRGICLYAVNEAFREEYEEKVMMLAADELVIFRLNEKDLFEAMDHGYRRFEYKAD